MIKVINTTINVFDSQSNINFYNIFSDSQSFLRSINKSLYQRVRPYKLEKRLKKH